MTLSLSLSLSEVVMLGKCDVETMDTLPLMCVADTFISGSGSMYSLSLFRRLKREADFLHAAHSCFLFLYRKFLILYFILSNYLAVIQIIHAAHFGFRFLN